MGKKDYNERWYYPSVFDFDDFEASKLQNMDPLDGSDHALKVIEKN